MRPRPVTSRHLNEGSMRQTPEPAKECLAHAETEYNRNEESALICPGKNNRQILHFRMTFSYGTPGDAMCGMDGRTCDSSWCGWEGGDEEYETILTSQLT